MASEASSPSSSSSNSSSVDNCPHFSKDIAKAESEVNNTSEAASGANTKSEVKGTRAFTCFPKIALEIQRMIWKQACSVTRVVDIWAVPLVRQGSVPFFKYAFYEIPCSYKSHCEPPAILHATRESRSVGLESYSLAFEWKMERQLDGMNFTIQSPANIYINWEFDVLCPMPTPYLIDEHQILDDTVFGKVWNDFTRNLPQLRRIALDSDSAWWIPYILNEGPSELHEIILYKGEEYLPTEFEREDPIMLTFTEWKEEFDDISEYLAMASTELLKAAEEVEDAIKEHRELQGHGITALMHGSIEPTVKLVDLNVHQE